MNGEAVAEVEAIVLRNSQREGRCSIGEVVAVWGVNLSPGCDNDTVIGLMIGKPWPEQGVGLLAFYAEGTSICPVEGIEVAPNPDA